MDFSTNPVHEDIRRAVREVCAGFPDAYWLAHDESKEFPWGFYEAIARGGGLGMTVPTEYGGAGLGVTEAAIVEQEIAASGAGMNGCLPPSPPWETGNTREGMGTGTNKERRS